MNYNYLTDAAHSELVSLWGDINQVRCERLLWLEVMGCQQDLGLAFPDTAVDDYTRVLETIDLASIRKRELATKHDVKARIEEFNALAGHECIHLGMTSADVVENIYSVRIQMSLDWLEERHPKYESLWGVAQSLVWRGIKGPVGTQQDMVDLLGSKAAADTLDERVMAGWGFRHLSNSAVQTGYRSLDIIWASQLLAVVVAQPGKPWVDPLMVGHFSMVADTSGCTWQEGDVSSSVVRRVAIPNMFYLADIKLNSSAPPSY